MNRTSTNLIIDVLGFLGFVFLTSSGLIIHYLLPPGSGRWRTVWALSRHEWGEIHFVIAVLLLGIIAVHLFLHWRWVVSVVRGRAQRGRVGIAIAGLTAVLILATAPLLTEVRDRTPAAGHKTALVTAYTP